MIAAGTSSFLPSRQRPTPIPASTRASRRKASGLAAAVSAASAPNFQREPVWRAQIASSAKAAPSAKGNAPERTTPAQTTAKVQLDHRAVVLGRECERGNRHGRDG